MSGVFVRAFAPGRVNLIGDHTDYTGGLVFPMAIQNGVEVEVVRGGRSVRLDSAGFSGRCEFTLPLDDPTVLDPPWARYVGGVASVLEPTAAISGSIRSTLEVGGLSSSAAVEVAVALAFGFTGSETELALACQRAEHVASGVPCGIMDQLSIASGRAGHAMMIDCATLDVTHVVVPQDAQVLVVHSGQHRELVDSEYASRRAECAAAEAEIGPLREAGAERVGSIVDATVAARARHVISENARVVEFAEALRSGDLRSAGQLMVESHRSLADDFEVSTTVLDDLVDSLVSKPGVLGARLTGAGFGGSVVALAEPGALDPAGLTNAFIAEPSAGARLLTTSD